MNSKKRIRPLSRKSQARTRRMWAIAYCADGRWCVLEKWLYASKREAEADSETSDEIVVPVDVPLGRTKGKR